MFFGETYISERVGTSICWGERKRHTHTEHVSDAQARLMHVVYGVIPRPRIREGRRRVYMRDGVGHCVVVAGLPGLRMTLPSKQSDFGIFIKSPPVFR